MPISDLDINIWIIEQRKNFYRNRKLRLKTWLFFLSDALTSVVPIVPVWSVNFANPVWRMTWNPS